LQSAKVKFKIIAMNPSKVQRRHLNKLTDLPNIGQAGERDLRLLGYEHPAQLVGADPLKMYRDLCAATGVTHDPCVLDVFMSVTRFLEGEPPRSWWEFTAVRKRLLLAQD
jgi:Pathogenicity locus